MKICNFGSINIDHVYHVDHFVRPGETLSSTSYRLFPGGKGFNQSIALARAGADVHHAGMIGTDGRWLKERLSREGVGTDNIDVTENEPTGHAVIQVIPAGENAIFLYGGANHCVRENGIEAVLDRFNVGDCLLVQNEITQTETIIRTAKERGLFVVLNPAPMTEDVPDWPLDCIDMFIMNEIEGKTLAGTDDIDKVIPGLKKTFPEASLVLTLGERGVIYAGGSGKILSVPATEVTPVDTTGAGDTFIGFFLGSWLKGESAKEALENGCRAAALCIGRPGAADSIPTKHEVLQERSGATNDDT